MSLQAVHESHAAYRKLDAENRLRQLDRLTSLVNAAIQISFLSQTGIKALNFHAIG